MKLAALGALALALAACGANTDLGEPNNGTSSGNLAASLKGAAENCKEDAECESGVCFVGGAQSFCSVRCSSDNATSVCIAPFSGTCNNRGLCKRD